MRSHVYYYVKYSANHATSTALHVKRNTISGTRLCLPHMNENSSAKVNTINMKEFHLDIEASRLLIAK